MLGKITLLRRHMSRIPLVLLSDRDDVDDIVAAMEQGVRGYIPTSLEPSEAAAALQCVAAGGTFVPASAMIKFAQDRQDGARPSAEHETSALKRLTPRESEVLARLRQGKPNKIIAHELEITESTVKVFVRRILMKLHASNRTEVACLTRARAGSGEVGYEAALGGSVGSAAPISRSEIWVREHTKRSRSVQKGHIAMRAGSYADSLHHDRARIREMRLRSDSASVITLHCG